MAIQIGLDKRHSWEASDQISFHPGEQRKTLPDLETNNQPFRQRNKKTIASVNLFVVHPATCLTLCTIEY